MFFPNMFYGMCMNLKKRSTMASNVFKMIQVFHLYDWNAIVVSWVFVFWRSKFFWCLFERKSRFNGLQNVSHVYVFFPDSFICLFVWRVVRKYVFNVFLWTCVMCLIFKGLCTSAYCFTTKPWVLIAFFLGGCFFKLDLWCFQRFHGVLRSENNKHMKINCDTTHGTNQNPVHNNHKNTNYMKNIHRKNNLLEEQPTWRTDTWTTHYTNNTHTKTNGVTTNGMNLHTTYNNQMKTTHMKNNPHEQHTTWRTTHVKNEYMNNTPREEQRHEDQFCDHERNETKHHFQTNTQHMTVNLFTKHFTW